MHTLTRNRSLQALLLGCLITIASVLFEYARMAPDYRFLVEPWSVRGSAVTQGWVMVAISVMIGVLGIAIALGAIKENFTGALIATTVSTAFATILATMTDPRDIVLATVAVWGLAFIGALAVAGAVMHRLPESLEGWGRRGAIVGSFLVGLFVLALFVLGPLFEELQPLWLVVLVGFALLSFGVLVRRPAQLAAYRVVINGAVIALFIGATMGGSVRSNLLGRQVETIGVSADYLDSQITSGVMLTWLGSIIMILGAVGMWAKRRDQLEARDRAQRQRETAEESAQELGEKLEARI